MKKTETFFILVAFFFLSSAFPLEALDGSQETGEILVLVQGLSFWKEKSGGGLERVESLSIGDKLVSLGLRSSFKVDAQDNLFVKVRIPANGNVGWVRADFVVSNASLAVVKTEGAFVYSEPRDPKITTRKLPPMTLVAIFKDGGNQEFAKVAAYDVRRDEMLDHAFLSLNDLSKSVYDVSAAQIYVVALSQKNPDIRKKLLSTAVGKFGSTIFIDRILADYPEGVLQLRPALAEPGFFLVNDDHVNVRSLPDEKIGPVLTQLNRGAEVEVLEGTVSEYPIGSLTARWYKIKNPAGWIFGGFLSKSVSNDPLGKTTETIVQKKKIEITLDTLRSKSGDNRGHAMTPLEKDLAWDKPTFASTFWEDGYPYRATNGPDGQPGADAWRSAESDGAWFYVDLGEEKTFRTLVSNLFVDSHFSSAPETYYIVSNDLLTWQVVYDEVNSRNLADRWVPRKLPLPEPVTARYVGLTAKNWGGGWADLGLFAVLP